MKGNILKVKCMAKENTYMQMEKFMTEDGRITYITERDHKFIQKDSDTSECGKMVKDMEKEYSGNLMARKNKENISKEK